MLFIRLFGIFLFALVQALLLTAATATDINSRYDTSTGQFSLDATSFTSSSGSPLDYSWIIVSQPSGSTSAISGNEPKVGFVADLPGTYVVELQVLEAGVDLDPVQISLSTDSKAPVAEFNVVGLPTIGQSVRLDGRSSYQPDGSKLSYSWELVSAPTGSAVALQPPVSGQADYARGFVPDVDGAYQIRLTVSDVAGVTANTLRTFTIGESAPVANAGPDRSIELGATVNLDPFSSTDVDANGQSLSTAWTVIHKPAGSNAELGDAVKGRLPFTPDVAGTYVVQLSVSDGASTDSDTVVVEVGTAANTNIAPVPRVAVTDIGGGPLATTPTVVVGDVMYLSGVGSSDGDGDNLTYKWALVAVPDGSSASLEGATRPISSLVPDVAGDYIASLTVDDGQSSRTTTILLSSSAVGLVAEAGPDIVLPQDRVISVDGSASAASDPATATYMWSVLGLGTSGAAEASTIDTPLDVSSLISFSSVGGGSGGANPAARFGEFDLVVFENSNSRSQVYGRAFIGGNLNGQSSDYGNGLNGLPQGEVILTVGGNINGQPKNINNGGGVVAGGRANANINLNGGGQLLEFQAVDIAPVRQDMEAFSSYLTGLADTGTIAIPTGQPSGVTIDAVPGSDGVAVISIADGDDLFNNNKVQSIDINLNGAEAVVVNVGGNNVKLKKANFVGGSNNNDVRSKIIWNFHQAVNIQTTRHLSGSLLAPNAVLKNQSPIYGAVVVKKLNHWAAVVTPGFSGYTAFGSIPAEVDAAVIQLKVADANGVSVDTLLTTNGNIAPVAQINASSSAVDVGTTINLQGGISTDANGDALTYRWALLSRPDGSSVQLAGGGADEALTPDVRGAYVAQLIVSDGSLDSAPTTIIVFANNQPPVITSDAVLEGVTGTAYVYQAAANDPDGDALTWTLIAAPTGMTVDTQNGAIAWTPDSSGTFDVTLRVEDGNGGLNEQSYQIVVDPNGNLLPPVIDAVANITLRPGESVEVPIVAVDPEGSTITYWAANLLNGANLDAQTGVFSYTASDVLGTSTQAITVTDGVLSSTTSFTITTVAWPDTDPTALSGRVLDAADFQNGVETPVVGAVVTIDGQTATSNTNGEFAITGLPNTGALALATNGSTATAAADGSLYGNATQSVQVYQNAPNVLAQAILLARLNGDDTQLTTVTDTLPPELRSCIIQRADSATSDVIALSTLALQNSDVLPVGTRVQIWATSSTYTSYKRAGIGQVGSDGQTLEEVVGSVAAGSNIVVTPLPVTVEQSRLQPKGRYMATMLGEGSLQAAFAVPAYVSLGQSRAPAFSYNSIAADPRPIITANVIIPAEVALTATLEAELYVGGQRIPGVSITNLQLAEKPTTAVPTEDVTATASVSVSFDASGFPTGTYDYELLVFAGHQCSVAASKAVGNVFVNNRSETPYGSGWKPSDLQTINVDPDGGLTVEEVDGSLSKFEAVDEVADFNKATVRIDTNGTLFSQTADFNNDGLKDFATIESTTGLVRVFLNSNGTDFVESSNFEAFEQVPAPNDGSLVVSGATEIAVGDMNGDGLTDILVPRQLGDKGIAIYHGSGDGKFTLGEAIEDGVSTAGAEVVDLDGDGKNDIVAIQTGFIPSMTTLRRQADGSFVKDSIILDSRDARRTVSLDIDNDGDIDVVTNGLYAYLNDGSGNISRPVQLNFNSLTTLNQTVDVQKLRDGSILGVTISEDEVTISRYNKDRSGFRFNGEKVYQIADVSPGQGVSVRFVELNADGYPDVLFQTSGGANNAYVIKSDSLGNYGVVESFSILHELTDVRLADFDNDGVIDLLTTNRDAIYVDYGNSGETNFVSPFGDFTNLEKLADGSFTRTFKDGTVISFNADGQQTNVADSNGNTTAYTYDANGALASITDPTGQTTQYTYVNGKLASTTTPDGRTTQMEFDARGNVIKIVHPDASEIGYGYDDQGKLISATDKRGNTSTFDYGAGGRLQAATAPDGASTSLNIARSIGLDELGAPSEPKYVAPEDRVTTASDARGNVTVTQVNEFGAVIAVLDPLDRLITYTRNEANLTVRVDAPSSVTPDGIVTTEMKYDVKGNVIELREAVGTANERSMSYEYELERSRMTKKTDYDGNSDEYTYDSDGNMLTHDDRKFLQNLTTYTYNDAGQVTSVTDRRGNVSTQTYDTRGLPEIQTDAAGFTTRNVHDAQGRLVLQIQGEGTPEEKRVSYTYDEINRQISMINGEGEETTYAYDAHGNKVLSRDQTGVEMSYQYDARNRLVASVDPAHGTTTREYDNDNNLVKVTAPDGGISTTVFDEVSRVSSSTDAINVTRQNAYDLRNNIIAVTDGRGNTTTFAFDELDRNISRTNPVGNTWQFQYSFYKRDLVRDYVKPDGSTIRMSYSNLDDLLTMGPTGEQRTYTYDNEQNLTRMTAVSFSNRSTFTYDARNLLATTDELYTPVGKGGQFFNEAYTYDAHSRRTERRNTWSNTITSYAYDKADRTSSVTASNGKSFNMAYDAAGRRTSVSFPNGMSTQATFETPTAAVPGTTGRLLTVSHGLLAGGATGSPLNTKLGTFAYAYDVKGNLTGISESGNVTGSGPRTRSYQLDTIDRLTKVTDGTDPSQGNEVESYALDEEGNRITSDRSSFYLTDPANRVSEDENNQFEYDVNGNLVRKTDKITGETWRYEYTIFDELKRATRHVSADVASPAIFAKSYQYDAFGRLRSDTVEDLTGASDGDATVYNHDGQNIARTYVIPGNAATNEIRDARFYTHSNNTDELLGLALVDETQSAAVRPWARDPQQGVGYYAHTDHQGSIRAITDDTGAVVNEYTYGAYGNTETSVESIPQRFRYTGREWDNDIALMHYRARAYDPDSGRFLQEDPIWFAAGDYNVYRYVGNNPLNSTDPSGMVQLLSSTGTRQVVKAAAVGGGLYAAGQMVLSRMATQAVLTASRSAIQIIGAEVACMNWTVAGTLSAVNAGNGIAGFGGCDVVLSEGVNDDAKPGNEAKAGSNEKPAPPDSDAFPPLGEPGPGDGFKPKKNWDGKKVPNPNGRGYGYPDKNGNVWIPSRGSKSGGNSHGGSHWDVQSPGGGYTNVFPGGGGRGG